MSGLHYTPRGECLDAGGTPGRFYYSKTVDGVRTHQVHVCRVGHFQIAELLLFPVDDPEATPYADSEVTWEGLGLLDYLILPHYKSDHWESATIDKEVEFCTRKGIPFRTLRDGEVLVLELPGDSESQWGSLDAQHKSS